jgi:hypothetical protein
MIGFGQRQRGQRPRRIQPFQQHGPGPEVRLHQQHSAPASPEPQRRHLGGEALIRCGQPQRELLTAAPDRKHQGVRSVPGITVEREVPSPALLIDLLRQGVQPRAPFARPAQHGPERGRNGNHEDESITPLQPLTSALCRSGIPGGHCCNQTRFPGSGRRAVRCPSAAVLRRRPSRPYDSPARPGGWYRARRAGAVRLICRSRATGTSPRPAPARPQPRRWSIVVVRTQCQELKSAASHHAGS